MKLSPEIIACINKSVLCWLATVSEDHMPNVSPKEVFCQFDETRIIVANIASPQTVQNIKKNSKVCLSFIDVFVQKGYQIKGDAAIIDKTFPEFVEMHKKLSIMTNINFQLQKSFLFLFKVPKKYGPPAINSFRIQQKKSKLRLLKKVMEFEILIDHFIESFYKKLNIQIL